MKMLTIHQTRGELNTIENKKSENRVDRGGWASVDRGRGKIRMKVKGGAGESLSGEEAH